MLIGLARYFDLNLREIAKFYQIAKIAAYKPTHSSGSFYGGTEQAEFFLMVVFVPYLIALRMTNNSQFEKCVSGNGLGNLQKFIDSSDSLIKWIESVSIKQNKEKEAAANYREIIEKVYKAVFINEYDSSYYETVFNMEFCKRDKNKLLKTVSCLSSVALL